MAFLCTHTKEIMDDPVINICSHLFDRKVLDCISNCPLDKSPLNIDTCFPLTNELGKAITEWKTRYTSQSLLDKWNLQKSSDPLSSLDLVERKVSEIEVIEIPSKNLISPTHKITNAHTDDIHGIISSKDGFITGSKDTSVKMWNTQGELLTTIKFHNSYGYKSWITALHRFSNNLWAYGTRDGNIFILNQKGEKIRNMANTTSQTTQNSYTCKTRNKTRINCITETFSDDKTTQFYVGTPKFVQLWDGAKQTKISSYSVDANDWVYCIETIEKRLAVVYGSTLQLWEMGDKQSGRPIRRDNMIVAPPKQSPKDNREHISSIVKLHQSTMLACAVFDGTLRVVDLSSQKTVLRFNEHQGRVWSVVKIKDDLVVSSGDDRTIKVWDLRAPNSIRTIVGGAGRVSSLFVLNEDTLLSGSCPDNVFDCNEKANITFWDLRTFTTRES